MNVGDKVMYVPDHCHALTPDAAGDFPWVVGKRVADGTPRPGGRGETKMVEMDHQELLRSVRLSKRDKTPFGRTGMELMHPKKAWPGIIKEVNDDGTVTVVVTGAKHGVTLECRGVKVDPTGKTPHTVHAVPHVQAPVPMPAPVAEVPVEQPVEQPVA